jgi:sporulation and spore germination protein
MIPRHLIIGVAVMFAVSLGMGFYAGHMRSHVSSMESAVTAREVAPPPTGPTEQVMLYVAYDDPGSLRPQSARIPLPAGRQQRAEELLRSLLRLYLDKSSSHALAPGSDVRNVYLVDPGLAVIDLNSAFADDHRSGVLVEELTVASLVETLSANIAGITRVQILVAGRERETLAGHAGLSSPYDVSAVSQMVGMMEAGQ